MAEAKGTQILNLPLSEQIDKDNDLLIKQNQDTNKTESFTPETLSDFVKEEIELVRINNDLDDLQDQITEMNNLLDEKVNIADIVDDLITEATNKPLSAKQGKILKDYIDQVIRLNDSPMKLKEIRVLDSNTNKIAKIYETPNGDWCEVSCTLQTNLSSETYTNVSLNFGITFLKTPTIINAVGITNYEQYAAGGQTSAGANCIFLQSISTTNIVFRSRGYLSMVVGATVAGFIS